ncbi:MAG: hypothetical protein WBI79_02350, partial [Kiritimatiellia bacterium]
LGLQPLADRLDVWFDYLRLGHIDLHTFRFLPIVRKRETRRSSSARHAARRKDAQAVQTTPKVLPIS